MARASGVGTVVGAVVQALRANAGVTALVPAERIVNYVGAGMARPYLRVDLATETADDTLALGGIDAICSVTVVSDYRGAEEAGRISTAVREALDAFPLHVAGFTAPADCGYQQAIGEYSEEVAGITVRYRPLWYRVRAL